MCQQRLDWRLPAWSDSDAWVRHAGVEAATNRLALWLVHGGRLWLTSDEVAGKSHLLSLLAAAYSLIGEALRDVRATVIYAEDDPVIPASGFSALPDSLTLIPTSHGGHCAFVERPWQPTWTDDYLVAHFQQRLMGSASRYPDAVMV